MSASASGQCLCGTVRFTLQLPSLWCAHCHCTLCRRAHGAGFVTWVGVASSGFKIEAGAADLHHYVSSPGARRSFCARCGSTLLFESSRWPGEIHVVLANIDTPIDRVPAKHAYPDDRAAWIPLFDLEADKTAS